MRRFVDQLKQILSSATGDASDRPWSGLGSRTAITLVCGMLYGGVMGSFGGLSGDRPLQIFVSATKVPLLLLATFAISLPSFFVINTLFGVRSDFPVVARALAGSQAGLTIVLAALAPYTLLWYVSFASYTWALLFNGLMFAIATGAAQGILRSQYRPLIAGNPRHRWLLRMWLFLYSFVAIQMAWVLRPFVGAPGMPVQFFREESWGNAYVFVGKLIWRAIGG